MKSGMDLVTSPAKLINADPGGPGRIMVGMTVEQVDHLPGYDRIAIRVGVLSGKPAIRGTRIGVDLIVHLVASGWTTDEILDAYPQLKAEDISQALHYAADLTAERHYPLLETA